MASKSQTHNKYARRSMLVVAAVCALAGCEVHPEITSATSHLDRDEVVVRVAIRSADAQKIRTRQLYTHLAVTSCNGESGFFAADPTIQGERIAEFRFPVASDPVYVEGRVPAHVFAKFRQPCASLRGGGYLTGKIRSLPVPVAPAHSSGPNNSFKPKPLRGSA